MGFFTCVDYLGRNQLWIEDIDGVDYNWLTHPGVRRTRSPGLTNHKTWVFIISLNVFFFSMLPQKIQSVIHLCWESSSKIINYQWCLSLFSLHVWKKMGLDKASEPIPLSYSLNNIGDFAIDSAKYLHRSIIFFLNWKSCTSLSIYLTLSFCISLFVYFNICWQGRSDRKGLCVCVCVFYGQKHIFQLLSVGCKHLTRC